MPPGGPPLAWTGRDAPPQSTPIDPEPAPRDSTVETPRRLARGSGSLLPGVLVGAGIAAAIVAAAIYLRPDTLGTLIDGAGAPTQVGASSPMPEDATPAVAPPAPDGGSSPTDASPEMQATDSGGTQSTAPSSEAATGPALRLRVGPDIDPAREAEILAALRSAAAPADVLVERIPFRIAASRVGYYHAADRAAAEALAERLSAVMDDGGALAIRDYGELLPDAEHGRLDLWVADPPDDG